MATNKSTWLKVAAWVLMVCLWSFAGCDGKDKPAKPRTRDQIFQDLQSLPTLYLTGKTKSKVTAPANKGQFVDEKTGEICWRVMECGNPDCPGQGTDGKPLKFIAPDPTAYVKPDGTIDYDQKKSKEAEKMAGGACPECLKNRNLKAESNAIRNKYAKWIKPHVLPGSAKRKKELEAELEGGS
jgi:hypothetical protein